MTKYFIIRTIAISAILIAAIPTTYGVANASTITATNSTLTSYDFNTGTIDFSWDQSSQYNITGTTVTLHIDDIITSGPRVVGTLFEFIIPNFYDPLPMKKIEVTIEGKNGGASGLDLPDVLDIVGADSAYGVPSPAVPVIGSFVSGTTSSTLVTEYWEMFPNPDFEIVKIFVPVAFELQSIKIETQSTIVPVPASIWLFGSGLLGLVGISRRIKSV